MLQLDQDLVTYRWRQLAEGPVVGRAAEGVNLPDTHAVYLLRRKSRLIALLRCTFLPWARPVVAPMGPQILDSCRSIYRVTAASRAPGSSSSAGISRSTAESRKFTSDGERYQNAFDMFSASMTAPFRRKTAASHPLSRARQTAFTDLRELCSRHVHIRADCDALGAAGPTFADGEHYGSVADKYRANQSTLNVCRCRRG